MFFLDRFRFSLLIIFSVVTQLLAQTNETAIPDSISHNFQNSIALTLNDSIIDYGKLFLKTPYRYGSTGENSFDCSGFTSYIFKNFGYKLDRSSSDQAQQAPTIHKNELKKGDLVFFEGRRRNGRVGHVGIVTEISDSGFFNFIHAAVSKGVTISNSLEPYYAQRFVKAGRIINADSAIQREKMSPDFGSKYSSRNEMPATRTIPAVYHKVRKGDNLSSLSEKYGVGVAQIKKLNKLKSTNLQINQQLKIKDAITVKAPERQIAHNKTKHEDLTGETVKSDSVKISTQTTQITPAINSHQKESSAEKVQTKLPETKTHKVAKGETLYNIARENGISVNDLKRMNNLQSGKIHPGQKLVVAEVSAKETPNSTVTKVKQSKKEHKVLSGESLFSIARIYNTSVDKIRTDNNLQGTKIQPGQILIIESTNSAL